jgi:hypothetical protein
MAHTFQTSFHPPHWLVRSLAAFGLVVLFIAIASSVRPADAPALGDTPANAPPGVIRISGSPDFPTYTLYDSHGNVVLQDASVGELRAFVPDLDVQSLINARATLDTDRPY